MNDYYESSRLLLFDAIDNAIKAVKKSPDITRFNSIMETETGS